MDVLVVGATGVLGTAVTVELARRGHRVRAASRSGRAPRLPAGVAGVTAVGVDVLSGAGLRDAIAGCDASVDASGVATVRRSVATAFFTAAADRLVEAGAGRQRHHVVLSIVGIDGVRYGYYQGKVAHEQHSLRGGAVSVVRATQCHEFAGQVSTAGRVGSLRLVPRLRCRPIAAASVAEVVVDRLEAGPTTAAITDQVGGPAEEWLPDLVRRWCAHEGLTGRVLPVRLPGQAGRAMADGTLCPPEVPRRGPGFGQWLAERA